MDKKTSGVKAYFKGLTKRQRIVWIVAVVTALVLIAAAVTLAIVFTRDSDDEKLTLKRKEYYYALKPDDAEGIGLNVGFAEGLPAEEIEFKTLKEVPGISVSGDYKVTTDNAAVGSVAEFSYSYKGLEIAKISVEVVSADAIEVDDGTALGNIANGTGTYIITSDIDVSVLTRQISGFSGKLFGNHRILSGKLPKGGLFASMDGAEIRGLELSADSEFVYTATEIPEDGLNIGVLSSYAYATDFSECYVTGKLTVNYQTPSRNVNVRIGGIVGFAEAAARSNLNAPVYLFRQCESDLNIAVSGSGAVYLGGIYGMALNTGAENLRTYGKIAFNGSAPSMSALNAGGIGGMHEKDYGAAIAAGHELESANRLYFYGEIELNVADASNAFFVKVGGIFGRADTFGMTNAEFRGVISVTSSAPAEAGGIVGEAYSDLNVAMRINGLRSVGKMTLNVDGAVYGGGIAGAICGNVEYLNVTESFTPEIVGGTGENRIADAAVAKTE